MSHATYYVTADDDIFTTHTEPSVCWLDDDTPERYAERRTKAFFRKVAELFAFNDCYDLGVDEIVYNGRHIHYTGWQPSMVIEFADDETGEIVYSGCFPEWDH